MWTNPDRITFTPYELGILLHYYVSPEPYENAHAPIYGETTIHLCALGLLQYTETDYALTPRGEAFVKLSLCHAPIPVQKWALPERQLVQA